MKKFSMAVGAAIALAGVTAPAQAQNLTWFGTSACFTGAVSSPVDRFSIPSCNLSSSTSTSISWDSNESMSDRSTMEFDINGYNNSGTSNDWPGGPASSSTNRTLSFAGPSTKDIYLGYFAFNREGSNGESCSWQYINWKWKNVCSTVYKGDDLSYTYLSMKLNFDGGVLDYSNKFKISALEQDGVPDGIVLEEAPWMDFTVGGNSYSFRVSGLDNWTNNNPSDDANYCGNSIDATLPTSFSNDAQRKICGQIRYNGSPNIQTVPEPSTYALMGAGLLGIFGFARRRRANA